MELHSFDSQRSVAQSHDGAGAIFLCRPGTHFKLGWQAFFFDDERVVASGRHRSRKTTKDALVIVRHCARLAVHQVGSANHSTAKSRADGLMSEANPKDRYFAGEMPDQVNTDASVLRRAWSRRDY